MVPFTKELGKTLLIAGGFLVAAGLLLFFGGKDIPFLGDLPGDIKFERGNFRVYFPLGTAIIISLGGSIILNFIIWLINR